ncbi:DUF7574 domain-containing protein [Microbacterium jejuense]|uniref:DUF7574 domain-containing protein n=1 Tax=Microbacterium jejuense TaxID=1263637 RepID=UPI0031EF79DD
MSYYDDDFSKIGIRMVAEADLTEPDYSFDLVGVWKHTDGSFYLGTDSGCSCPSPGEDYKNLDQFTGPLTRAQAIEEATSLWTAYGEYDPPAFAEFIETITKA